MAGESCTIYHPAQFSSFDGTQYSIHVEMGPKIPIGTHNIVAPIEWPGSLDSC